MCGTARVVRIEFLSTGGFGSSAVYRIVFGAHLRRGHQFNDVLRVVLRTDARREARRLLLGRAAVAGHGHAGVSVLSFVRVRVFEGGIMCFNLMEALLGWGYSVQAVVLEPHRRTSS